MTETIVRKKKPNFVRNDGNRQMKLVKSWRSPRGMHNKMRMQIKGHRAVVAIGYGNPKSIRHLTKDGLRPVVVVSIKDLDSLTKEDTAVISSNLGNRKRIELAKYALSKKISVLNLRDIQKFLTEEEQKLKIRKEEKTNKNKKKEDFKKKAEERAKEKDKKESNLTNEQKEEQAKEDKRKILENQQ